MHFIQVTPQSTYPSLSCVLQINYGDDHRQKQAAIMLSKSGPLNSGIIYKPNLWESEIIPQSKWNKCLLQSSKSCTNIHQWLKQKKKNINKNIFCGFRALCPPCLGLDDQTDLSRTVRLMPEKNSSSLEQYISGFDAFSCIWAVALLSTSFCWSLKKE